MASDVIGIVQVGTGGFGNLHLKWWNEVPEGEIVGVYDVNQDAAKRAAKEHGIAKVYGSLDEALAEPRCRAVTVITPNKFHPEVAIAALDSGKHCMCEKPLAATAADVRRMIDARDRSGKLLMAGQHMRFDRRTVELKKHIDAGRLGEVYYGRARWLRRRSVPGTPGFISSELAVRGPGADLGVHVLDLAMHLMGQPKPVSVSGLSVCKLAKTPGRYAAWAEYDPAAYDVEDFAAGWVRFANGCVLLIEVSWMLNIQEEDWHGLDLFGDRGGANWPELNFVEESDGLLTKGRIESVNRHVHDAHKREFAAFCEAIREGKAAPVPPEESLVVARILDGLYESGATGKEVVL